MTSEEIEIELHQVPRLGWAWWHSRKFMAYMMVLPAILILVGIVFYPIAQTFWLSLHEYDLRFGNRAKEFIGLSNYSEIFSDSRIWEALRFTTLFAVISVGLELVFGIGIALLLNREFVGRTLVRALILIPWALTTVVVARMWGLIYNSEYGILNSLLKNVGLIEKNQLWTANQDLTFWAVIGADVWKSTPFMVLILLAGLQTIPADLYEAAKVDGANPLQGFWHITLPGLRGTMVVALIFRTIDALRVFDLVIVLTNGQFKTESLNLYTYNKLINQQNFGFGSALAIITFCYIAIIALLYLRVGQPSEKKI
ncbi:MAG: sugar ABC transporter permease [Chloroflexi bacterium]|nr:sugar ABC transporter permease [Chloroflexota bacterium]